ncbi:hypothetical protein A3Q56_06952 [Intoshia linei]|uniref:Major facilitator superfamily (MFS) profile domain-containing protein n=1 Tax=Intoshia linei TaxID=1819745 RepID=A0A177AU11_9BILA|nr:hypothetical protein A3Q56_06952 [Intoshia linei]
MYIIKLDHENGSNINLYKHVPNILQIIQYCGTTIYITRYTIDMKNIQIYTTNSSTDINSSITICSICNTVNCDSENKSLCNSEREFKFKRISFKYILNHRYFILIVFCITHLFIFSTYSILAPFYPIEARKKGVNGPIIGLVIGVFELSSVIFSPLIGKLITKVNSIVILATGIFFSAGCVILFGAVSQNLSSTCQSCKRLTKSAFFYETS